MCGIVGLIKTRSSVHWHLNESIAGKMVDTLRYRGPDGQGDWYSSDGNCWLGHTRLAIIDVAAGHQPMANEDNSLYVSFNGEIYNHALLREELRQLGHAFKTHCDTEVLVHGYEQWGGKGLVQRLQGMFAFCVYDQARKRAFIARDRVGIKPLYWWSDANVLLFASEIKAMLVYPPVAHARQVDHNALSQFLTFRYVPAPLTMFKNIQKLPAGHYIEFDIKEGSEVRSQGSGASALNPEPRTLNPQRYWDLSFKRHDAAPTFEEALENVDKLLRDCVDSHLMSEVPLGAQLSGGVDSSLIVAQMALLRQSKLKNQNSKIPRVQTFSIGFREPGYSELPYARAVAEKYNCDHHAVMVGFKDFAAQFARMSWMYDEPVSNEAAIPTYLLCDFAKKYVTVMLTGEGGDELFAGYPKCAADQYSRYIDWMPTPVRRGLLRGVASMLPFSRRRLRLAFEKLAISDPAERYVSWFSPFDTVGLPHLLHPQFQSTLTNGSAADCLRGHLSRCDSAVPLDRMLYSDTHTWLVDDLLVKGDRMSMASGIEARVPFLDHTLVEYAAGLPPQYKAHGTRTKILLKKLAERYMPHDAIYRKKVGFAVPLGPWFLGPLRNFVRDTLLSDRSLSRGYYKPEVLRNVVEDHFNQRVDRFRSIWSLLSLELWHRLYIDDDASEAASERLRDQILATLHSPVPAAA